MGKKHFLPASSDKIKQYEVLRKEETKEKKFNIHRNQIIQITVHWVEREPWRRAGGEELYLH